MARIDVSLHVLFGREATTAVANDADERSVADTLGVRLHVVSQIGRLGEAAPTETTLERFLFGVCSCVCDERALLVEAQATRRAAMASRRQCQRQRRYRGVVTGRVLKQQLR